MDPQIVTSTINGDDVIEDVGKSTWHYVWREHGILFGSVVAVCAILSGVICIAMYEAYIQNAGTFQPESFIWLVAPLFIAAFMYSYFASKVQHMFMQQMAASLAYAYSPVGSTDSVDSSFFQIGHSRFLTDVMSGIYRDHPVRFFTYQYTIGSGKTAHTYILSVFELTCGIQLPHVTMNFPSFEGWTELESVELEGGFSEKFSLKVEKGKQIEIREIFQPDVMQDFITSLQNFTMEIYHDHVYLMRHWQITNKQQFLETMTAVDHLYDDLLPGLRSVSQH